MENMSAMDYEILIRRAYDCGRYGKKGADADIFRGLEREEFYAKEKPNDQKVQALYQKKLMEVRGFAVDALNQAVKRLMKGNVTHEEISKVFVHVPDIENATNKNDLAKAIRRALDTFIELKIEMN